MPDFALKALSLYPMILTEDLLRYVLGAGAVHLLVNLALGRVLAHRRIRPGPAPGWPQIRAELRASLRTVLLFSAVGLGITALVILGLLPVYLNLADRSLGWFTASVVLLIVLHDAWFYWTHRLMHRPGTYRHLHREHHQSHRPTAFAAYRFDATEALAQAAFLPLALTLVPAHPLAIFLFTAHMILRNALGHSGVEVFPARADGRPRWGWLTTVTHHDLHHAEGRWNFGLYFTWWDRLGGTEHPQYLDRFAAVATRSPAAPLARPMTLLAATLLPLLLAAGPAAAEQPLRGDWATEGLGLVVRFDACPDTPALTCGTIVHSWDTSIPAGTQIVHDLAPDGTGWSGRLTDPRNGHRYKGTVRRPDADTLDLRGCAGPICARQTWHSTRWLRSVLGGMMPPA